MYTIYSDYDPDNKGFTTVHNVMSHLLLTIIIGQYPPPTSCQAKGAQT